MRDQSIGSWWQMNDGGQRLIEVQGGSLNDGVKGQLRFRVADEWQGQHLIRWSVSAATHWKLTEGWQMHDGVRG